MQRADRQVSMIETFPDAPIAGAKPERQYKQESENQQSNNIKEQNHGN